MSKKLSIKILSYLLSLLIIPSAFAKVSYYPFSKSAPNKNTDKKNTDKTSYIKIFFGATMATLGVVAPPAIAFAILNYSKKEEIPDNIDKLSSDDETILINNFYNILKKLDDEITKYDDLNTLEMFYNTMKQILEICNKNEIKVLNYTDKSEMSQEKINILSRTENSIYFIYDYINKEKSLPLNFTKFVEETINKIEKIDNIIDLDNIKHALNKPLNIKETIKNLFKKKDSSSQSQLDYNNMIYFELLRLFYNVTKHLK